MVVAAGAGCSVQTGGATDGQETASIGQFISTPLSSAHAVTFDSTLAHEEVDIVMNDETAEIYINPADSSLMVNGVQAIDTAHSNTVAIAAGSKANIKVIKVTDTVGTHGDILILNYVNGVFGIGTTLAAGTQISLKSGSTNTLIVKATALADSYAIGPTGTPAVGTAGISLTAGAKTPLAPTLDITTANVGAYDFFMNDGNDTFTSNAAVTGHAFGSSSTTTIAIYGGNGDDTLIESAAATPKETFSGGPGNDTVDYSLRTAPVYVAVDSTGLMTSGASPLLTVCSIDHTVAGATEADVILDADIILGGSGNDILMGDKSGVVTLNGGLGNDLFCEGTDAYKNGTDTIVGGGGADSVDYSMRHTGTLSVTLDGKTKSGDPTGNGTAMVHGENDILGADVQNIYLGSGGTAMAPSVYTGNTLNNTFFAGTGGYATVNGSDGNDTLDEGTDATSTVTGVCLVGDMVLPVCPANNAANETFNGGKGIDTVDYHKRSTALTVKMDGATHSGATSEVDVVGLDVENVYGGSAADHLEGNLLDNDIEGNGGGDTLCGLLGNDTLLGNTAPGDSTAGDAAHLHGNDCADAVAEPAAFNMCLHTGTDSSATPVAANTANCQFVSQ